MPDLRVHEPDIAAQGTSSTQRSDRVFPRVPYSTAQMLYTGLQATSAEVQACEKRHGERHKWTTIIVTPDSTSSDVFVDTEVTICARCCVRRCDAPVQMGSVLPCVWPIHHRRAHRDSSGYWREVGK